MATCEMCGDSSNSLFRVGVAGSVMNVCRNCKNMGNSIDGLKGAHTFNKRVKANVTEEVVSNYFSLIQKGMNKKGVDVHQLARVINIKESTLTNYFKGKIKPAISDAKKIQSFLDIVLVEEVSSNMSNQDYIETNTDLNESSTLDLNDLIKQLGDKK